MKRLLIFSAVCLALLLVGLLASTPVAHSQSDAASCPEIVSLAVDSTRDFCEDTGRNQVCYGHVLVDALPQADAGPFTFSDIGDMVDLLDVRSLTLTPMDEVAQVWGISLLRLQANLPVVATDQYATLLAFGDVQLENAAEALPVVDVTANTFANVRRRPTADDFVLLALTPQQTVVADGRLEDSSWVRVILPETGESGWVSASLVSADAGLEALAVVEATSTHYNPFQAFFLQTGVGDAPCAEAPESGIMIQTPEGVAEVRLLINEVAIRLGSTAFLQAVPGGEMTFSLLEGSAFVEAFGVTQQVFPGTHVRIPLNEDGVAAGSPSIPEPYDAAGLAALPLGLLGQEIVAATPMTWNQINTLLAPQEEEEGDDGEEEEPLENVVEITHASYSPGNQQVLLLATYNGGADPEVTLTAEPGGEMEILGDHYQLAFRLEEECPCVITVTASTGESDYAVVDAPGDDGDDGGDGGGPTGVQITQATYSAGNGQVLLHALYNGGVDPAVTLTASPGGVMEILGDHYQLRFRIEQECPCTITVTSSTGYSASVTVE